MFSKSLVGLLTASVLGIQSAVAYQGLEALGRAHLQHLSSRARFDDNVQFSSNSSGECTSTSCYRYYNKNTQPYLIKSLPEVDFAIGEFYGGSVAINKSDPSRTLFFIFKPAIDAPVDEVTVWLNGGPGCSSLEGFFQENGPILWQAGTQQPVKNPYTWAKTTNMLWVEQPVGTGFAQGKVTATNEVDVAKDFVGFFQNWEQLFGIKDYKIYMTGESYAGRYVPYISAQMLDQKNKTYFDLSGALVYDPCIGDCGYVQMVVPTAAFINANNDILNLNSTALAALNEISARCGYTNYLNKYLVFPPSGHQPNNNPAFEAKGNCDVQQFWGDLSLTNPCFDIYHITDFCPLLYDVVGGANPYFNRKDVKQAIHAPLSVTWSDCTNKDVFVKNQDTSPDSIISVLPQVIEATNRVLVSNADWDGLILTNGTLMNIQNMTWNGKLGFQSAPTAPFVVPIPAGGVPPPYNGPQGVMGKQHYERGLQWVETYQSGHMQPQYQPAAAYRHLEWVLGRIPNL